MSTITKQMTLEEIRRIDAEGMFEEIKNFPSQWTQGREGALNAELAEVTLDGINHVVIIGMGGSAIGGDLFRTLARDTIQIPVQVSRSYSLPAYVGPNTLVIASSYSGNTEESLSALQVALDRGATIACITTGGKVQEVAEANGLPFVQMPGGKQPRAALGFSLTALLTLVERLGLFRLDPEVWLETHNLLQDSAAAYSNLNGNQALDLANRLQPLLPVVYSAEGIMEAVNVRWRTQIHENSKMIAYGNFFPELNHNEIMGWEHPGQMFGKIGVVVLKDQEDHPQVQRRISITADLLRDRAGDWIEIESNGTSKLSRMMSLVHLGDWVSLYLSILNKVDPTPVGLIGMLKDELSRA